MTDKTPSLEVGIHGTLNTAEEVIGYLFNREDLNSFWNKLPHNDWREKMIKRIERYPHFFKNILNEEAQRKYLLSIKKEEMESKIGAFENKCRYYFWLEYERAVLEERQMDKRNIYSLACKSESMFTYVMLSPYRLAWLLTRMEGHAEALMELYLTGVQRMRAVLEMDPIDKDGKVNTKLLELQVKITAIADARLHGLPTQKLQQLNVNLNASTAGDVKKIDKALNVAQMIKEGDMAAIQRRLLAIKSNDGGAKNLPRTASPHAQALREEMREDFAKVGISAHTRANAQNFEKGLEAIDELKEKERGIVDIIPVKDE